MIARLRTALTTARTFIADQRANDFAGFTVAGDASTMDDAEAAVIAEYDAVLAEIDGALNDGR